MTAQQTKAKPRSRKPIYLVCRPAIDPDTGELRKAWWPLTKWDAREMHDRKYHSGTEVRAEFKKRRNVKFHRLAHAIGAICVEQLQDFNGMDCHDALKRLQMETGAQCELIEMNSRLVIAAVLAAAQAVLGEAAAKMLAAVLPQIHTIQVKQPRSIAFDEMDEGEFQQLVKAIYDHLSATYWTDMTSEAVELMVEIYERDH